MLNNFMKKQDKNIRSIQCYLICLYCYSFKLPTYVYCRSFWEIYRKKN